MVLFYWLFVVTETQGSLLRAIVWKGPLLVWLRKVRFDLDRGVSLPVLRPRSRARGFLEKSRECTAWTDAGSWRDCRQRSEWEVHANIAGISPSPRSTSVTMSNAAAWLSVHGNRQNCMRRVCLRLLHTNLHTHTSKPHLVNIKINTSHLNNKKDKDRLDLLFHLIKLHWLRSI